MKKQVEEIFHNTKYHRVLARNRKNKKLIKKLRRKLENSEYLVVKLNKEIKMIKEN
jgi:hypothetical protein